VHAQQQVELIDEARLKELIAVLLELPDGGKNVLKPVQLAGSSPGVFWSLVHSYGSVRAGLAAVCPTADWSFLDVRERKLSEKALENARQQQGGRAPKKARTTTAAAAAGTAAAAGADGAVVAVDSGAAGAEPAAAAAAAAVELTPEQKLQQLNDAVAAMRAAAAASGLDTSTAVEPAVVAAVGDSTATAKQLLKLGVQSLRQLADCEPDVLAHALAVDKDTVDEWLASARGTVLDELMDSLIDDDDLQGLLEEVVKVSTPVDMVIMAKFADALISTIKDALSTEEWTPELQEKLALERVQHWYEQCLQWLKDMPWLESWVYSADDTDSDAE
jgi:DNA-binding transcriptional regulator YiaG